MGIGIFYAIHKDRSCFKVDLDRLTSRGNNALDHGFAVAVFVCQMKDDDIILLGGIIQTVKQQILSILQGVFHGSAVDAAKSRDEGEYNQHFMPSDVRHNCKVAEDRAKDTDKQREAKNAIREAKAEAEKEAILRVNEAQAMSIRMINEANPDEAYMTLKKLEALEKMGDGNATKIVIPSELQGIVGLVNTIKEAK